MFDTIIFDAIRADLQTEIGRHDTPAPDPLKADTWLARSAMQKAIRRGMLGLALSAAATLLRDDPRTLWRRLIITALEDLGPAEIDTTARIVAAYQSSSWRRSVGGDWRVISELVQRACDGSRCQSANDAWHIALHCPDLEGFRLSLDDATASEIIGLAADPKRPVQERAVAVLLALGETAGATAPDHVRADPQGLFEAFDAPATAYAVAVYGAAYRATRVPLAALCLTLHPHALMWARWGGVGHDDIPPPSWLGPIPTFAADQYTRAGKASISAYVRTSSEWAKFAIQAGISRSDWSAAAGELLFRAEGAAVTRRKAWALGMDLRLVSSTLGCFMPQEHVAEGMALTVRQLPLIDQHRRRHLSIP